MVKRISLILYIFFLAASCTQKMPPQFDPSIPTDTLVNEAKAAWKAKEYSKSSYLYRQLLTSDTLSKHKRLIAWQKMTYSALFSGNYELAQSGVQDWAKEHPQANYDVLWLQANILIDTYYTPENQYEQTKNFFLQSQIPWKDKAEIVSFVADFLWREKNYLYSLQFTRLLYAFSPQNEQYSIQQKTLTLLQTLTDRQILALEPQTVTVFPDNCLATVAALNILRNPKAQNRRTAYEDLLGLSYSDSWQHFFPFQKELEQYKKEFGRPKQEIALLLPLSDNYAKISYKIIQGAEVSLKMLFKQNFDTQIRIINSNADDWLEQLQTLPKSVTFVGGPLRKTIWKEIVKTGLNNRYIFFTFLAQIENEGEQGWRFFSSPQDQVHSLISVCLQQNPETRFADLYPNEQYGKKMHSLFKEELQKNKLDLKNSQSYPAENHKLWGAAVAKLLTSVSSDEKENRSTKLNKYDLDVVFLPDSFAAARQLIPNFFYNDAKNLLFLGSQLWETGEIHKGEEKYFKKAIFPASWWKQKPTNTTVFLNSKIQNNNADFWNALGFDFVRFFSRMPEISSKSSSEINEILQKQTGKMDWTLAPLFWDKNGKVQQKMYVFSFKNTEKPLTQ